jgi:hypothetical protein
MSDIVWTVRGTLAVDETWTTRCVDGTSVARRRPLAGVCVEVLGFPDTRACRSSFGTAVTDRAGRFRIRAERPSWAQDLLVRVRFADAQLVVGAYDAHRPRPIAPWLTPVSGVAAAGPTVELGALVFGAGAAGPLGRHAGDAEAWYVARTALTFLWRRGEPVTGAPLVLPAPLPTDGDPGAALRRVAEWWVESHDDRVPAWLVARSVRRALWPAAGGAERLTASGEWRAA